MARRRPRAAPQRRHPRGSGQCQRLTAPVALARVSGVPPGHPLGRAARLRVPAGVLRLQRRLSSGGGRADPEDRRPLRVASRRRHVARAQRVRLSQSALLLRGVGSRVPGLAGGEVRHDRRGERGVGHRVLVAALLELSGDHTTTPVGGERQHLPGARLRSVLVGRTARLLPRGGGDHPRRLIASGDDEFHGLLDGPRQADRLLEVVGGDGHRLERSLPDRRRSAGVSGARDDRRLPARPRGG